MVDPGVAANLLDADADQLLRPGSAFGPLLEGFVLMELARQLSWSDERADLPMRYRPYATSWTEREISYKCRAGRCDAHVWCLSPGAASESPMS